LSYQLIVIERYELSYDSHRETTLER